MKEVVETKLKEAEESISKLRLPPKPDDATNGKKYG
jgi:hypothetical protein